MNLEKLNTASRKLTQVLRHQVIDYNLIIDSNGYVKLDDIFKLNLKQLKNITLDEIQQIVETNEKKRLETIIIDNELYIRATQGHNKDVGKLIDDDIALEEITLDTDINWIYHGTQTEFLDSIREKGLSRMSRKHIHFVENTSSDKQISGFKKKSDVILQVNIKECMRDGIKFYLSSNNVILTEGINGIIEPKYIKFDFYS